MLGHLVSTSGLAPSLLGQKQIPKLNCDRNSDHLACCLVSFLVEVKYSRFLWSVTVLMAVAKPSKKCRQDLNAVGRILVHCKTCLQVPDSRVRAWSQQSCLRRDKIQYFGKVLQNSPLAVHKMQLNRAILTMILPCR